MGPVDLQTKLAELRKRQWTLGGISAAMWALAAILLTLVAAGWLDLLLDLPAGVRAGAWAVVFGVAAVVVVTYLRRTLRDSRMKTLVDRLENVSGGHGRIVAGVSLMQSPPPAGNATTAGLAAMAIEQAETLALTASAVEALPARALRLPSEVLGVLANALLLLAICLPAVVGTQAARFFDPYGDHPPYSPLNFAITPGDTRVIFGTNADIQANITGGTTADVKLVLRKSDGTETTLPMFDGGGGQFRATVLNVDADQQYYVTSGRARSVRYQLGVITIPKLADVSFTVTLPAYTHQPPYVGPVPQGGLSGLPGTSVEARVRSNRDLAGGTIKFTPSDESAAEEIAMSRASESKNVAGTFTITRPGRIDLSVIDAAGQKSVEPFSAPVAVLKDEKPFVRVMSPKPNSFATPDAVLDIAAVAEDDFGVSKVEIFRSLNDSRYRAMSVPVPADQPRRVPTNVPLSLAEYGLRPGDVVKLFVRVEDNDPAGAKGAESGIVTLTVISREELGRMMLAKQSLEAMEAKYDQARRELEAAAAEAERIEKELAKLPPDTPVPEALQKEMEALAERMAKAAEAVEKRADQPLPLDLDKTMTPQLKATADTLRKAAEAAKKAGKIPGVSGASKAINELKELLKRQQAETQANVTEPLEHLDKIMPLLEDQAKFLQLAEQQRDLAERLKSMQSKTGDDSPDLKARMRELQDEQANAREQTEKLLQDIDDHAAKLPADARLDKLRDTATKFTDAARKIDPVDPMRRSEDALQTFAGSPAAVASEEAAKRLESLIGQCDGMGKEAGTCLSFQPKLSKGLGNTVKQLLDSQSLGMGTGKTGRGQGGYSAQRSTMQNVGVYGNVPITGRESSAQGGGKADRGTATNANGRPTFNANPDGSAHAGSTKAEGESDVAVPPAYKGRVSDYFRRVADELDQPAEQK